MLTFLTLEFDNLLNWIWLIVFIGTILIEFATVDLNAIWFAAGSIFALILSALGLGPIWQFSVFFITSFLLLFTLGKYVRKAINNKNIPTNIDSFIGKEIVILEDAGHLNFGSGKINGTTWTIACEEGKSVLKGDLAIIKKVQGNKLIVEKIN